ncbi:MAG TPA: glycosyltransferase, partial [Verrucomicrobiae bacterium]|nr:glycosyltransferase [Verrucomicrobiae bacterium]
IALVSFFFTAMFFALARPLTLVVLGHKWENAAVIFAALSFAALQAPLGSCASWLLTSQGRGKDSFSAGWIISIIVAVSFVSGLPFGPAGVAIAYSASCVIVQIPVYYWLVGREGPVRTADLWTGFLKHLPVWGIVTLTAWLGLKTVSNYSSLIQLLVCIPISFVAGVAFIFAYFPSRRVAFELLSILRELRNSDRIQKNDSNSSVSIETNPCGQAVCVSVVIPTFNRERFVVMAVKSVLNQTIKGYEIIVIDDGSTDGTRSALEPYANQIRYVYQNNSGVSASRNAGIALAAGKWVAFLDSDDEWAPDFLARHMHAISQNYDVCMQIADCRYFDQTGEKKSYFETNGACLEFNGSQYLRPKEPFVFLLRHLSWQVGSALIRRNIIQKAGGFDASFKIGEDQDFLARVALHGQIGLLKDKLMTAYRRTEPIENLSKIAKMNPIASGELHEIMYRKWASIPSLSPNERWTVKWLRSENYRAIANLLLAGGKTREARGAYWTALKIYPSMASVGKYILSFLAKTSAPASSVPLSLRQPAQE